MSEIYRNLVGVFTNVLPPEMCQRTIEYFDNNKEKQIQSGIANPNFKDPLDYRRSQEIIMDYKGVPKSLAVDLLDYVKSVTEKYLKKYPHYYPAGGSHWEQCHLLKYEPGDGWYHYHYDNSGNEQSGIYNRHLSVIVYLNDVEEGGETGFEYIDVGPIKPNQGDIIIFPSGKSHSHRGAMPISGKKYIAVFWLRNDIKE